MKAWRSPAAGVIAVLLHFVFVFLLVRLASPIGRPESPAESPGGAVVEAPPVSAPVPAPRWVGQVSVSSTSTEFAKHNRSHPVDISCSQNAIGAPVCPKLFIIGCKKCGTTTLFNAIEYHPNVVHVYDHRNKRIKEFHFFDQYNDRVPTSDEAFRNYISRFPARKSTDDFAVDGTPRYMFSFYAPSVFASTSIAPPGSGARFIAILRDPVDRALSHMQWLSRRGDPAKVDQYNFTRIAAQCVRGINKCRARALALTSHEKERLGWKALPLFHCMRTNKKSISNGLCTMFARGMYADQLRRWLAEGYDGRREMCILETEETIASLDAALGRLQTTCFRDIGIDLSKARHFLPLQVSHPDGGDEEDHEGDDTGLGHVHHYESVDVKWPGARELLNRELFDELNEDLYRLLRDKFGMDSFRFRRRSG